MEPNQTFFQVPDGPMSPDEAASILGFATWLWLRSKLHHQWPVWLLNEQVLPGIRANAFALLRNREIPLGFATWASMSVDAEKRYLANPNTLSQEDWTSGDRVWIIDFVAPFGHVAPLRNYIRSYFRPTRKVVRSVRVRPAGASAKINSFFNPELSAAECAAMREEFQSLHRGA